MKPSKRVRFYLLHLETGQRYALINEDLVIGRSSGDILFGEDAKLSSQHCRLVVTPNGLGIHDLQSANGTHVNGAVLRDQQVYPLQPGSKIRAGGQVFELVEAKFKTRRKKSKSRSQKTSPLSSQLVTALAVVLILIAAFLFFKPIAKRDVSSVPSATLESPFNIVDREFHAAVEQYTSIGNQVQSGHLSDAELINKIRSELLPRFQLVQSRLWAIRPTGDWERRQLELNRQIAYAVIGQVSAMAEQAQYHSHKSSILLKKYSADLEKLSAESAALKKDKPPPLRL